MKGFFSFSPNVDILAYQSTHSFIQPINQSVNNECMFSLNQTCLSHVGGGDQRHGIRSCPPRQLCVGGEPDACSHCGELLSVRDTLGVALFCFGLYCCSQHCCVLASWYQSTNKEKHTKL